MLCCQRKPAFYMHVSEGDVMHIQIIFIPIYIILFLLKC